MASLSSADYRSALNFIASLYATRERDAYADAFVRLVGHTIPCDVARFIVVRAGDGPERQRVIATQWPRLEPHAGGLSSHAAFRETLGQPFELTAVVLAHAAVDRRSQPDLLALALGRRRDFSDRERALLELLMPHVCTSYENLAAFELIAPRRAAPSDASRAQLTVREREVLGLVTRGATNRAVARTLGVSPRTVQKHLEHIFRKLGVETRTAAAAALRDDAHRSMPAPRSRSIST